MAAQDFSDDRPQLEAQSNGHSTTTTHRLGAESITGVRPRSRVAKLRLSRAESNRLNAQKSTGPRTEAGKAKSRYNALKHGMTAESSLLPGEDAAEFEARRWRLHDDLSPRNGLEAMALDKIALHDWLAIRAERAARNGVPTDSGTNRSKKTRPKENEPSSWASACSMSSTKSQPLSPESGPGGPAHPARLVLKLEKSIPGCDWLIGRFRQLESRVHAPGLWTENDGFELVRLLGHHLEEVITEYSIAYVLLASHYLADESETRSGAELMAKATSYPVPRSWIKSAKEEAAELARLEQDRREAEAAGEFDPRVRALAYVVACCEQNENRMKFLPLERLLPAGVEEARLRLAAVIERELTRLEQIRAQHVQIAEADAAGAGIRQLCDRSPDSYRERRYMLARDRLWIQSVNTFLKLREASLDGTLDQIEIRPGDRPDVENPWQSPEPSLALRAGMTPSAPAGDDAPPRRQRTPRSILARSASEGSMPAQRASRTSKPTRRANQRSTKCRKPSRKS